MLYVCILWHPLQMESFIKPICTLVAPQKAPKMEVSSHYETATIWLKHKTSHALWRSDSIPFQKQLALIVVR